MVEQRRFLGVDYALIDQAGTLDWIEAHARGDSFAYVVTPNVDHVVMLHQATPDAVHEAYEAADLRLCDSMVLIGLARLSGLAIPPVKGSDLTAALLERPRPELTGICLVGGDETQAQWLRERFSGATIAHHVPPMGLLRNSEAQEAAIAFVEAARSDIVLLTVGAPQSEVIARAIKRRGRARGVALCVGASLEFVTGAKSRAPRWMQVSGIEWLHRLLTEPRRLWRRYLVRSPQIFLIWLQWLRARDAAG